MVFSNDFLATCKRLHFAGIGGISMSTIAALAVKNGCIVSGSDKSDSEIVKKLAASGIGITIGHKAENVEGCDAVVYTAALDPSNPELVHARELGIPLVSRGRYLGYLMNGYKNRIGVSGTHGKTTTTGMISHIFMCAALDPTVANGAVLPEIGSAYKAGCPDYFIYEACEYKDSFLSFSPTDAVITNIELDHTDYFSSLEHIISSFSKAVAPARRVFVNKDNESAVKALDGFGGKIIRISLTDSSADYYACNVHYNHGMGAYTLMNRQGRLCDIELGLIGEFNIYNSLCASAVACEYGIDPALTAAALHSFTGAVRRFERRGVVNGIAVYDDYAHHPSECASTLNAAVTLGYNRIFCIFQSHTYSRTHDLLGDFEKTFTNAERHNVRMIYAPIYAARETDEMGVSAALLAKDTGGVSFNDFGEIAQYLADNAKPGDLVLTMGAGDVYKVGNMLLEKLNNINKAEK